MTCSQFEALLAEALDGVESGQGAAASDELAALPAELRTAFAAHRQSCANCGPLYAEVREGMLMLRGLVEVDPPRNLVHNILAVTSGVEQQTSEAGEPVRAGWLERMRTRLVPSFMGVLHSRFAASFCMAFFSLSLTFSLTGIKISDIARMATHPSELRKTVELEYSHVQARVMRYYENMRLVYQVEAFGRDLKKAAAPGPSQDKETTPPDQQNLIRPAPSVPGFKEVVHPHSQNAFNRQWHNPAQQLAIAHHAERLPDLRKLSEYEIAQIMRKTEGARI
jgi:hypothetical protein